MAPFESPLELTGVVIADPHSRSGCTLQVCEIGFPDRTRVQPIMAESTEKPIGAVLVKADPARRFLKLGMIKHEDFASRAAVLGGVPVWGTVQGSAAESAGLKGGDILLRVNGVPGVAVGPDLDRDPFGMLELQILRGKDLVCLTMSPDVDECVIRELGEQIFGRRPKNSASS